MITAAGLLLDKIDGLYCVANTYHDNCIIELIGKDMEFKKISTYFYFLS